MKIALEIKYVNQSAVQGDCSQWKVGAVSIGCLKNVVKEALEKSTNLEFDSFVLIPKIGYENS